MKEHNASDYIHNHIPLTPWSLVWDRGRGKHPRSMTAETLTFPEKAAWLGPISSTCTWTHMLWDTNRVNEISMGSFRALLSLGSQNSSGMDALQNKDLQEGTSAKTCQEGKKKRGFSIEKCTMNAWNFPLKREKGQNLYMHRRRIQETTGKVIQ